MTTQFRGVNKVHVTYIEYADAERIDREDTYTNPERVTISDSGYVVVEEAQASAGDSKNLAKTHIIPLSSIHKMTVDEIIQL